MDLRRADLNDPQVLELVRLHLAGMHDSSPPGTVYALNLSGLTAPNIELFAAWERRSLLGIGALREIDPHWGEIKSMRTHPEHLRRGVGSAILSHLLATARARGYRRVSLETGSGAAFEAAISLYRSRGFIKGEAFGGYTLSAFNQFMHLELAPELSA